MILSSTLKKTSFEVRWEIIKHFRATSDEDALSRILTLHVARLAIVFLVTCLWVAFTLSTGHLTAAFVVLLGVAIGCTQFFIPKGVNRFYLPSALVLTLLGGIISNVLAGLAFFSSKMGVSYWQVLDARRFPEDIQMLSAVFLESFRPEDLFFYAFALTSLVYLAQKSYICGRNAGQVIPVQLTTGKVYRIGGKGMDYLLSQNKVIKFMRSDGWAVVGKDRLRDAKESVSYSGFERRYNNHMVECC